MYATVAQFIAWSAGKGVRLEMLLRCSSDQIPTQVALALEAAAGYMDGAFQEGGYVVPIDPATVSDSTERSQLTALLADRNCALAYKELQLGLDGIPEVIAQTAAEAIGWLNSVRGVKGFDGFGHIKRVVAISELPGVQRVA